MADPLKIADPLKNDVVGELGTRAGVPLDIDPRTGLAESTPYAAPLEDPIRKGQMRPDRELPESGNPQLNRTARQVGGAIGEVVSQAKRLPGTARRRLYLVRNRAQEVGAQTADQISSSTSSLAGNAQERLRGLGDVALQVGEKAQQRASQLMDMAEDRARVLLDRTLDKTEELATYLTERTSDLKQEIDQRTQKLRNDARIRLYELRLRARYTVRERPLETLGVIAGAAFILGVALRMVRSRNASR
jgi:ElaB/YqjD/DUF883 family membrane-anchored ribosome-binding protein